MSEHVRPTPTQLTIAVVCLAVVLAGAFIAARATLQEKTFSLSPPAAKGSQTIPGPDATEAQRLDLHRTFYTAWAALLLVIPALSLFPLRRSSSKAAGYWLAFWSASLVAFAVHLYWAVVVFFEGDWSEIMNTTRVSAPVIDTVFAIWWAIDVLLAWTLPTETRVVRIQRAIVHLLAFVLFVAGAAIEGETGLSRALGYILAAAVTISIVVWIGQWRRRRTLRAAPVTE